MRLFTGLLAITALVFSFLAYQKVREIEKRIAVSQPGIVNLLIKKDLQDAMRNLEGGKREEARQCLRRALDRLESKGEKSAWDEINRRLNEMKKNIDEIWKHIKR